MIEDWKVQGSDAWLSFRQSRLGGSDAASVMGENPYRSNYMLWLEKTGRKEVYVNDAMRHGTELEPLARCWYEGETGISMSPVVVLHPKYPDFMASLDGISFCGTRAVEIKCPYNNKNHLLAVGGVVPPLYRAQLQHQMMCAELKEIDFCSYFEGQGVIIKVKRDDAYIERLIEKELEFLQWIKDDVFPGAPDTEVSNEVYEKIVQLKEAKRLMEESKAEYENLKNELMAVAGGPFKAHGCTLTKSEVKGSVDYKSIPELKDVDLEAYRKPSREQWTVNFEKERE